MDDYLLNGGDPPCKSLTPGVEVVSNYENSSYYAHLQHLFDASYKKHSKPLHKINLKIDPSKIVFSEDLIRKIDPEIFRKPEFEHFTNVFDYPCWQDS